MNILFIMYDQLRFDYLSCAGHPHLSTPNFDRVASMGVRFTNAYVQSPICGASRMSTYTGRYVSSHGAQWNGVPLRVGEFTLGDHLRDAGMDCWLIGKTHMKVDAAGMERLGLTPESVIGARQSECGFDVWVRDDGLWAQGPDGFYDQKRSPYNEYLNSKGYEGDNPWADFANAGVHDTDDADTGASKGDIASGWMFLNVDKAANIKEQDSETPWLTTQAIDFIEQAQGSWCAHVSYIKPHWPYIVPAPYNTMYNTDHMIPVVRDDIEKQNPQPVYDAYAKGLVSTAFSRTDVREKVIPAYMGLIKQCDDQLGRLLEYLEKSNQLDKTMIVLTSDHGDYLGDHWLGEKNLFHEPSVKVPLIVYDPRQAADDTRGSTCNALVESIDLAPTFVAAAGGKVPSHILEGMNLEPYLHGTDITDREYVISEYDYSLTPHCEALGVAIEDARLFMVFDGRYKLMHAEGGFRPMLFDLESDPDELTDLAKGNTHNDEIDRLYDYLASWGRRLCQRVARSDDEIRAMRGASLKKGILPFMVTGKEVPENLTVHYRGKAKQRFDG